MIGRQVTGRPEDHSRRSQLPEVKSPGLSRSSRDGVWAVTTHLHGIKVYSRTYDFTEAVDIQIAFTELQEHYRHPDGQLAFANPVEFVARRVPGVSLFFQFSKGKLNSPMFQDFASASGALSELSRLHEPGETRQHTQTEMLLRWRRGTAKQAAARRAFLSKVVEDVQQQLSLREQRKLDIAAEILGAAQLGAADALGRLKELPRELLRARVDILLAPASSGVPSHVAQLGAPTLMLAASPSHPQHRRRAAHTRSPLRHRRRTADVRSPSQPPRRAARKRSTSPPRLPCSPPVSPWLQEGVTWCPLLGDASDKVLSWLLLPELRPVRCISHGGASAGDASLWQPLRNFRYSHLAFSGGRVTRSGRRQQERSAVRTIRLMKFLLFLGTRLSLSTWTFQKPHRRSLRCRCFSKL